MRKSDHPFWIFAYGSLMWNPGFEVIDRRPAQLVGFHRALCILSWHYRGTRETPGLVLGLDSGGTCDGFALRARDDQWDEVMSYLNERELSDHVYDAHWLPMVLDPQTDQAQEVRAYTFTARKDAPQYRRAGDVEDLIPLIRQGCGLKGPCIDYVRNTYEHLVEEGIEDPQLCEILRTFDAG